MSNKLRLISGIFLIVMGFIILWETSTYNLIDIFFALGFILVIAGVYLIFSCFIRNNRFKDSKLESLNSKNSSGPLKIKKDYNSIYKPESETKKNTFPDIKKHKKTNNVKSNPKAVLNVVNTEDNGIDLSNKLKFTPNYDKPLKVTRKPKKREPVYYEDDVPYLNKDYEKSDKIKKALYSDDSQITNSINIPHPSLKQDNFHEDTPRDIKIDINNPESLPIPKLLKSFVVSEKGTITSKEAFEELAIYARREIMLEIPSLNDLSDRFLSQIPTIPSRIIIEDFNVSDISYIILIASLIKQGVYIKTLSKVNKTNLITDDSHALIITGSNDKRDFEFGAIYDDRKSISEITNTFDRTWNLASDLDKNVIFNYND